jgi:adenine specific DNA methylase Mod
MSRSKYGSKKCIFQGEVFDSKHELNRYQELRLMEEAGIIKDLKRQVKFELLPAQYSKTRKTKKGKPRCIEKSVSYIADFVYMMHGERIVEDAKGFKTPEYRLKKKLLLWVHGIEIVEV